MPRDSVLVDSVFVRNDWDHVRIPSVVQGLLLCAALVLEHDLQSFTLRTCNLRPAKGGYRTELTPFHDGRIFLRVTYPQTNGWYEFGLRGEDVSDVRNGEDPLEALLRHLRASGHSAEYGNALLPPARFSPPAQEKPAAARKRPRQQKHRPFYASDGLPSGLPLAASARS